jgi:AsmA protein
MDATKVKSILIKAAKYTGISIIVLLCLMFLTPIVFSDKIKEEIKKTANKKLAGEMNYSNMNISFFKHFPVSNCSRSLLWHQYTKFNFWKIDQYR